MVRNIIGVILLVVSVFLLVLTWLISPYRDELDLDPPQVDADALLVLRTIYVILLVLSFGFIAFGRSKGRFLAASMFVVGLVALVRLIITFSF